MDDIWIKHIQESNTIIHLTPLLNQNQSLRHHFLKTECFRYSLHSHIGRLPIHRNFLSLPDFRQINDSHPLRVEINKNSSEPSPYIVVRKNLEGLISRNVYYKLIDLCEFLLFTNLNIFIL